MNMLKTSLLLTALLTAPVTFSALAQQPVEVARVSVSAIAAAPSVVEHAIARLAQEKKATSGKSPQCALIAALTQPQFCTSEESLNGKVSAFTQQGR